MPKFLLCLYICICITEILTEILIVTNFLETKKINFPPKRNVLDFKLKTEVQILKLFKCPGIYDISNSGKTRTAK